MVKPVDFMACLMGIIIDWFQLIGFLGKSTVETMALTLSQGGFSAIFASTNSRNVKSAMIPHQKKAVAVIMIPIVRMDPLRNHQQLLLQVPRVEIEPSWTIGTASSIRNPLAHSHLGLLV